jgi:hypothetical protein
MASSPANARTVTAESMPEFFVWQIPEKPVTVDLSLDVISRMNAPIVEAFKSLPRRGLEIGGLLLGRIEPGHPHKVIIEDFEAVDSEHLHGPSYALSPRDIERLQSRLAYWRSRTEHGKSVVGYYRANTRPVLCMDDDDLRVAREFFADPAHVFLLVKPAATGDSVAGFFFWENGQIQRESSYQEFPFDSAQLRRKEFPLLAATEPPSDAVPIVPQLDPRMRRVRAGSIGHDLLRWWWVPASVVLFLAGWWLRPHQQPSKPAVVSAGHALPANQLGLNVERNGKSLKLTWDRNAPAVRHADGASLWISDGEHVKKINLDPGQLERGSVAYWPTTGDIDFRLEVYSVAQRVSESVRALGDGIAPAPEPAVARPANPPSSERSRVVRRKSFITSFSSLAAVSKPNAMAEKPSAMARPEPPKLEPPPILAVAAAPKLPDPVPSIQSAADDLAMNSRKKLPQPAVMVSWEAAPESGLRHLTNKIPWVNRLPGYSREGPRFTPAQPVRRFVPVVPPEVMRDLPALAPADVRVRVDDWGHVGYIQLLSGHNDFGELATRASAQWRFLPARLDGRPVDCEMILHFRLRPPHERDENDLAVRK